ncbi:MULTISPECIES: hypothetical protein [unclassified Microbacterium]|uniref:hypothetical protein n=1 Tax=unclassified Microbacterium TaxID=2609290 RepID=UPI00301B526B
MKIKTRIATALAGVALAAVALTGCGVPYSGGPTTGCTVTDKYVDVQSKSSRKVIATSCGVFMVEDELSTGQWNSADLYAKIRVGKTYDLTAYGPRNGFLSLFPNVAAATEVGAAS